MMKKSLLALAVAALSVNAFATNLDDNTGVTTYAKEISLAATPTMQKAPVKVTAGFALATDGYVRFDLANGAKFNKAGPLTLLGNGSSLYSVASGGAGENYVIFRTDGNGVAVNEVLTLTADYDVVSKDAVSISYNLYETAANAVAKTGSLNSKTGTLLNFASALSVTATDFGPSNIDAISWASKKFVGGADNTSLLTLSVADAAGVQLDATGTGDVTAAIALNATTSKWSISGNFSAVAANGLTSGLNTFTLASDKQSAELADLTKFVAPINYKVTTTDEIAETAIGATFTPVANAGYEASSVNFTNATRLVKNGTTRTVNLALKPGGAYSNFVRISNTDTISGLFFVKVFNDAGESVSFPLSDVAGQAASIGAGASTTQMSIQSIFDAATAKGLTLSGEGKLRLEVTGQTNGLDVQTYTISKDGNSFATF